VWLHSEEPEKTFLRGSIQVAAAFHYLERGNFRGTRSLLERAQRRLEGYADFFWEMDVSSLCKEIAAWLRLREAGKQPTIILIRG
jgi:predicted metal-dependent hydrolase